MLRSRRCHRWRCGGDVAHRDSGNRQSEQTCLSAATKPDTKAPTPQLRPESGVAPNTRQRGPVAMWLGRIRPLYQAGRRAKRDGPRTCAAPERRASSAPNTSGEAEVSIDVPAPPALPEPVRSIVRRLSQPAGSRKTGAIDRTGPADAAIASAASHCRRRLVPRWKLPERSFGAQADR